LNEPIAGPAAFLGPVAFGVFFTKGAKLPNARGDLWVNEKGNEHLGPAFSSSMSKHVQLNF
jgi:hypothetical protein